MLRLVLMGASSADRLGPPDKRAIFYCTLPDRRNENTFPVSSVIIGDPCGQAMYAPGEHPEQHLANYAGLMQADAYAGFNELYEPSRHPGRIVEGRVLGADGSSSTSHGCRRRLSRSRRSTASMRWVGGIGLAAARHCVELPGFPRLRRRPNHRHHGHRSTSRGKTVSTVA